MCGIKVWPIAATELGRACVHRQHRNVADMGERVAPSEARAVRGIDDQIGGGGIGERAQRGPGIGEAEEADHVVLVDAVARNADRPDQRRQAEHPRPCPVL